MQRISNAVICPVCQKYHSSENIETFPKNEYIIEYIRQMKILFPKCQAHGKELSLYCAHNQCKTAICQVCLIKDHMSHGGSVVDISEDLEEKKEHLLNKVDSLTKEVEDTKTNYLKKRELITENNAACIAAIESRRRELDDMIRKVTDHTPEVTETIDENVKTMDGFLTNLEDLRKSETTTYENVREKLESVAEISRCFQMILSDENNFEFYDYNGNNELRKLKLTDNAGDDKSEQEGDSRKTRSESSKSEDDSQNSGSEGVIEKEGSVDRISEQESDEDYDPFVRRFNSKKRQVRYKEELDTDTETDTDIEDPWLKKIQKYKWRNYVPIRID